jgi:hypothetical protein
MDVHEGRRHSFDRDASEARGGGGGSAGGRVASVLAICLLVLAAPTACGRTTCDAACRKFDAHLASLPCGEQLDPACHTLGPCDCGEEAYYECLVEHTRCEDDRLVGPEAGACDVLTCR